MARRPLLAIDAQVPVLSRQSSGHSYNAAQGYGTILPEGPSNHRASPERYRRDSLLDRVPEETAVEQEDEELEERLRRRLWPILIDVAGWKGALGERWVRS